MMRNMKPFGRHDSRTLFIGDMVVFIFALWATLLVRYGTLPEFDMFYNHIVPFSFLFLISGVVYFVAGLYDKHTLLMKKGTVETILYAQLANTAIAAIFFFLVPIFGIEPRTNLAIYLMLSSACIITWRTYVAPRLRRESRMRALLIGSGSTYDELFKEVNAHERYPYVFVEHIKVARHEVRDIRDHVHRSMDAEGVSVIILDVEGGSVETLFPDWYERMLHGIRFVDAREFYESIFDRVPVALLEYQWFIKHVFTPRAVLYGVLKRVMDVFIAGTLGVLSLPLYPLIASLIKSEDGGPVFFTQARVGRDNAIVHIVKFRSMSTERREKITKFGAMLRKYRIDELPQLWNVFKGDLSMIGPRPESPHLAVEYARELSFYNTRHLIEPGLSGWAQINDSDAPKGGVVDLERTKRKLEYDLYYIKNKSLMLDLMIALKTIRTILSRSGT
jgi:lipopolysaccharide/colanic/teichoic acid biosynthesis glycosyltransferase